MVRRSESETRKHHAHQIHSYVTGLRQALKEVEADWETDFPEGSPEGERYEVLLTLVEVYEEAHFTILDPDPISRV